MEGRPVKVLIVDDQMIARSFFEMHIQASPRYEAVHALGSAEAADIWCQGHEVDLVLMDVVMAEGVSGLEAAARIKRVRPEVRIVIVTSMPEVSWQKRAREIGVEGFWYKEFSDAPLLSVLDRVMAGETVYPDAAPVVALGDARSTDLTEQELAVLRELTLGSSNEEIAARLFVSVNTVRWHVQNLLSKTGYDSRIKLAIFARSSGLVVGDPAAPEEP